MHPKMTTTDTMKAAPATLKAIPDMLEADPARILLVTLELLTESSWVRYCKSAKLG
jgi:hypothetical protein